MKWLIRLVIRFYRYAIRPALHAMGGPASGCRFHPSCSQYFLDAVEEWGSIRGSALGIWRILRCHPWGKCGYDPVPKRQGNAAPEDSQNTQDHGS